LRLVISEGLVRRIKGGSDQAIEGAMVGATIDDIKPALG
jgi:hypothetical protein